ncbi:MAG: GDSL-type esterase/lipase family protein [Veillonellales bacterium]
MKRIFIVIILLTSILYIAENSTITGFSKFKPSLTAEENTNEYSLLWTKVPYLAYYEVEVLNRPPDTDKQAALPSQRITKYRTWNNTITVDRDFPFQTYWRVSAQGVFRHPLGRYSDSINLAQVMGITTEDFANVKPQPTSLYPVNAPAGNTPTLTWTVVPGAIYYEFEFLSAPPENPNGIEPSRFQIFSSREVFANGYNVDLSGYPDKKLYWRVRALDYDGNPRGVFSDAVELNIDHSLHQPLKPLINTTFNVEDMATPLYPVYSWIPLKGAVSYEVEITDAPPENPNGTTPSQYRIWRQEVVTGADCYDEQPRNIPGIYYWRVRGLNIDGDPVGVYSDAEQFVVDLAKGNYSATFGDSITHGGGAVSYSPSDWEYDYQTYLKFPTINLGKSGDTSESMVERFDQDVLPYHPKYLIILGGTNSLRGGTPATQVIKDLSTIRDKCLFNGIRPIFLTLPPINPSAINRAFSEETTLNWREQFDAVNVFIRQQRYYIDLDPYFCDADRELPDHYAIDGLHPDLEGKKLMAQIINVNWARVTR